MPYESEKTVPAQPDVSSLFRFERMRSPDEFVLHSVDGRGELVVRMHTFHEWFWLGMIRTDRGTRPMPLGPTQILVATSALLKV